MNIIISIFFFMALLLTLQFVVVSLKFLIIGYRGESSEILPLSVILPALCWTIFYYLTH